MSDAIFSEHSKFSSLIEITLLKIWKHLSFPNPSCCLDTENWFEMALGSFLSLIHSRRLFLMAGWARMSLSDGFILGNRMVWLVSLYSSLLMADSLAPVWAAIQIACWIPVFFLYSLLIQHPDFFIRPWHFMDWFLGANVMTSPNGIILSHEFPETEIGWPLFLNGFTANTFPFSDMHEAVSTFGSVQFLCCGKVSG